jgi:hypothetical protein
MNSNPSDSQYQAALAAAEKLAHKSEDALFEELGLRIKDRKNRGGKQRSLKYEAEFTQKAGDMLSTADLKRFGQFYWKNLQPKLMSLVCDKTNEDIQSILNGKTIPQVAAGLATSAVVAAIAAPPAWLIVATTILATMLFDSALDTLCEMWKEAAGS